MIAICFVCLGNICRSPTAEGIFRSLVRERGLEGRFLIESAGTAAYHVGRTPDRRSRATAAARGVELNTRGQQFERSDFARFDYVVAMDRSNAQNLQSLAESAAERSKIHLLRDFDAASPRGADVPDPYGGGARGFEKVFDLIEAACRGLLAELSDAGQ